MKKYQVVSRVGQGITEAIIEANDYFYSDKRELTLVDDNGNNVATFFYPIFIADTDRDKTKYDNSD